METSLRSDGLKVSIGDGIIVSSPGFEGKARSIARQPLATRGPLSLPDAFLRVLLDQQFDTQAEVEFEITGRVQAREGASRSTHADQPGIAVSVPDAGENFGQVACLVDEAGLITWHFADAPAASDVSGTRGGEQLRTYVIPGEASPPAQDSAKRGLIGWIGKKVLKVLVFPITDLIVGHVGEFFVRKWEDKKRPYRLRTFRPEDYQGPDGFIEPNWGKLAEGRSLLFVHGTFSRAHAAFHSIPQERFQRLFDRYQGRVFAFDHPTLATDPWQNVEEFRKSVPDGMRLETDVVCHSRGGLVSRALAAKASDKLRIRRIVYVAVPNSGTALTSAEHMRDFMDTYTNFLHFFPDNFVTDIIDGVVTVVKQLAVGVLKGLDGLLSMDPGGDFLKELNRPSGGPSPDYYAVAANYEPDDPALKKFVADRVMDRVFDNKPNDLVVPTNGVWQENGAPGFPIRDRLILLPTDAVAHGGYFGRNDVGKRLESWLVADATP